MNSIEKLIAVMILLLFLPATKIVAQQILSDNGDETYTNPVIPGDHPDCTVTRVENDFYTTGSSFNPTPVIYHSTDLVHWEAIAQPVSASWSNYSDVAGGGCWGGHIVYYNGEYWDFFSRGNVMHFVKAKDPKGPWSEPVKVKDPSTITYGLGYDNSIFIDDDNKWYLVVKNGQPNNGIVELDDDGQPTGLVYNLDWLNPSPAFQYSWAEGPVMWKYNDYYFYSFALNVAGGQKVMRSKTLTADQASWEFLGNLFNENDPQKGNSLFASPNHSSPAIMLDDSTSWVIHPLYAKGEWIGQGRQGLLNRLKYDSDSKPVVDYPINSSFPAPKLPDSGIPWMVPKSDFFTSETLHPEWSFLGFTAKDKTSLTDRSGWLRLTPKSVSKANTVIKNDSEHNYSLITRMDFSPSSANDEAGLRLIRGDETQYIKLCSSLSSTNGKIIRFSYVDTKYETENIAGDTLWLKIERINHKVSGYYSSNGKSWTKIGQAIDISVFDAFNDFSTWAGARQGLYVQGKTSAFFDLYIYRDAFNPILAECPANQYGTTRSSLSQGIRALDNIHGNDWALYAGVEFGNGDYYGQADSVEFTVSSATSGGMIEVWLDSIGNGKKISECTIEGTGSWSEFKTFKSSVSSVTGNHDVYLKFTGTGTDRLFQLKWINFTNNSNSTSSSQLNMDSKKVFVYPNPTENQITVNSYMAFNDIKIYDMNGRLLIVKSFNDPVEQVTMNLNLKKGIYILRIFNEKDTAFSRLIID